MLRGPIAGDQRTQRHGGLLHPADQSDVDRGAATELLAADVDLHDLRLLRIELPVREVGAEHQQRVGLLHGAVPRRETEQPRHADVVRVVLLDVLLAAQRVHDRCLQRLGERDHLVVRPRDTGSGEDRDLLRAVEHIGGRPQLALTRQHVADRLADRSGGPTRRGLLEEHVTGDHHDGHAALFHRGTEGELQHPRKLRRIADQLAVHAALPEQLLRVRLLEVVAADLGRRDVRGDREHRHAVAVRVEQPVDEVQIARSARPGHDGERAVQLRIGTRRECRRLLVPHVQPADAAVSPERVGEGVERVARQPPDPIDSSPLESVDEEIRNVRHALDATPHGRRAPRD